MANEALERVWMRVRDEIRRQRGLNRFRGAEVHLLPRRQIRIPVEARGSRLRQSEMVIHLAEVEADLWAILEPEGERYAMADFDHQLEPFVAAVLAVCRGEAYLHTNSDTATYRKEEQAGKEEGDV